MNLEHTLEEAAAERCPAALRSDEISGGVNKKRTNVVAFKFGGSSLLGAKRMLHAAGLVRDAATASKVVGVVSAMRGVTDLLRSVERALASGKLAQARREAESIQELQVEVMEKLGLDEEKEQRVRREMQLLGRDLLYEVLVGERNETNGEFSDRLASFGERFSARLFAVAL